MRRTPRSDTLSGAETHSGTSSMTTGSDSAQPAESSPTDHIAELVNWQMQRPGIAKTVARCLTHGTEWDADASDFCPECPDPLDVADGEWYAKANDLT